MNFFFKIIVGDDGIILDGFWLGIFLGGKIVFINLI